MVVSHKATNVSCKRLGGTVPKVSKTSNSDTLSLGHFLLECRLRIRIFSCADNKELQLSFELAKES